jgi:phosphatidylserine/phosphatidylglycerophosphate/cardiolipin synthase-like enzyme
MFKWLFCCILLVSSISAKESITNYRALFSPKDHLAEELISMIDKERTSIKLAMYCLTHRQIVKALTQAQQRGVDVQVIVDPFSLRSNTVLKQTKQFPFAVYVWNPAPQYRDLKSGKRVQTRTPLMHDKFCVFGSDRVWTGSFNCTRDATLIHQENALIIESSELASSYLGEFERIKREATTSLPHYIANQK